MKNKLWKNNNLLTQNKKIKYNPKKKYIIELEKKLAKLNAKFAIFTKWFSSYFSFLQY